MRTIKNTLYRIFILTTGVFLVGALFISPVQAAAPHAVMGEVFNADGSVPEDKDIQFEAYIVGRPNERLTNESPGSGYSAGIYSVQLAAFSSWTPGYDLLVVEMINSENGESTTVEVPLTGAGIDARDMQLE